MAEIRTRYKLAHWQWDMVSFGESQVTTGGNINVHHCTGSHSTVRSSTPKYYIDLISNTQERKNNIKWKSYCFIYLKHVIKIVIKLMLLSTCKILWTTYSIFCLFLIPTTSPKHPCATEEVMRGHRDGVNCPGYTVIQTDKVWALGLGDATQWVKSLLSMHSVLGWVSSKFKARLSHKRPYSNKERGGRIEIDIWTLI